MLTCLVADGFGRHRCFRRIGQLARRFDYSLSEVIRRPRLIAGDCQVGRFQELFFAVSQRVANRLLDLGSPGDSRVINFRIRYPSFT